jgi:hypothetical protein
VGVVGGSSPTARRPMMGAQATSQLAADRDAPSPHPRLSSDGDHGPADRGLSVRGGPLTSTAWSLGNQLWATFTEGCPGGPLAKQGSGLERLPATPMSPLRSTRDRPDVVPARLLALRRQARTSRGCAVPGLTRPRGPDLAQGAGSADVQQPRPGPSYERQSTGACVFSSSQPKPGRPVPGA